VAIGGSLARGHALGGSEPSKSNTGVLLSSTTELAPTFAELGADPRIAQALAEDGIERAFPIQEQCLPLALEGNDLIGQAKTGTGKTLGFGIPLLQRLDLAGDRSRPQALVVVPTRELCVQVADDLQRAGRHLGARVLAVYGGRAYEPQIEALAKGIDVVVGTPGRVIDLMTRKDLSLASVRNLVLDEADEMLDLGFREDLEFILETTPPERRTLMFSATLPRGIVALAKRYQRDAQRIDVARGERGHADIEYRAVSVAPNEIELVTVNLLRYFEAPTAIVFCNTRESVRHLHATLLERGFLAVLLSGELSQHERNHAMQALRDGRARICIATDVAARGIDLPNLSLVIHADLPHNTEALQHRSGRTGRAGRKGVSALLVPASRRRRAERLLADAGVHAKWSGPPTAEEIHRLDQNRLLQDPLLTEEPAEEDFRLANLLLAGRTPEQLVAALVRVYRSRFPSIEQVTDPGPELNKQEIRGKRDATTKIREASGHHSRTAAPHGEMVWFRLNIGRKQNADPKWLLPMLCRRGNVTKQDIGAIRIFDHETKVEIVESHASEFVANMARPGGDNIRAERSNGPTTPRRPKSQEGSKPKFPKKKQKQPPKT